jgi:hypothetical protein
MKVKIDVQGYLQIDRVGEFKYQFCPFSDRNQSYSEERVPCGDWCPLFGQVELDGDYINPAFFLLKICHATFRFPDQEGWYIDERGAK